MKFLHTTAPRHRACLKCGLPTNDGKPYCEEHVLLNPYAAEVHDAAFVKDTPLPRVRRSRRREKRQTNVGGSWVPIDVGTDTWGIRCWRCDEVEPVEFVLDQATRDFAVLRWSANHDCPKPARPEPQSELQTQPDMPAEHAELVVLEPEPEPTPAPRPAPVPAALEPEPTKPPEPMPAKPATGWSWIPLDMDMHRWGIRCATCYCVEPFGPAPKDHEGRQSAVEAWATTHVCHSGMKLSPPT